jgi:hypothetical protein
MPFRDSPYFNASDYSTGEGNFRPAFTGPHGLLSMVTYLESRLALEIDESLLVALEDVSLIEPG